jgi:hypothetical protein
MAPSVGRGECRLSRNRDRWDEFCMAHSATTINENGICWQHAVRGVVQRSSTLLELEPVDEFDPGRSLAQRKGAGEDLCSSSPAF